MIECNLRKKTGGCTYPMHLTFRFHKHIIVTQNCRAMVLVWWSLGVGGCHIYKVRPRTSFWYWSLVTLRHSLTLKTSKTQLSSPETLWRIISPYVDTSHFVTDLAWDYRYYSLQPSLLAYMTLRFRNQNLSTRHADTIHHETFLSSHLASLGPSQNGRS